MEQNLRFNDAQELIEEIVGDNKEAHALISDKIEKEHKLVETYCLTNDEDLKEIPDRHVSDTRNGNRIFETTTKSVTGVIVSLPDYGPDVCKMDVGSNVYSRINTGDIDFTDNLKVFNPEVEAALIKAKEMKTLVTLSVDKLDRGINISIKDGEDYYIPFFQNELSDVKQSELERERNILLEKRKETIMASLADYVSVDFRGRESEFKNQNFEGKLIGSPRNNSILLQNDDKSLTIYEGHGSSLSFTEQDKVEKMIGKKVKLSVNSDSKMKIEELVKEQQKDHTYLRNEKGTETTLISYDHDRNKLKASFLEKNGKMVDVDLEKVNKNSKDLYFAKTDSQIIMVLANEKNKDELQMIIGEKNKDIKSAKVINLQPENKTKELSNNDKIVQKINKDLKMNLNLKNKEVSKDKGLGL